ncbi:putative holin-like toxin [Virgibacillus indicus]|nr:putative holin-like toxin [Virgibacillus indicus]
MGMYEVLMVLGSFGTLLIALLALVITMINNKK